METTKELKEQLIKYIDAELSKVKKTQIEVGKWYNSIGSKSLQFITEYNGNEADGRNYGFDFAGNWMDEEERYFNSPNLKLATPLEIETALITHAQKKYKVGDVVESLVKRYNVTTASDTNANEYFFSDGILWMKCEKLNLVVFEHGKWAKVIEQPKQQIQWSDTNRIFFTKPITPGLLTKIKNLL